MATVTSEAVADHIMSMILGAAALAAGLVLTLATALIASGNPDIGWLVWVARGFQFVLVIAGFFGLSRRRASAPSRWPVVVGAFAGGVLGFVLALVTTSSGIYARGDEIVESKRVQTYEFVIRLFGRVVYREIGPAVQRTGPDGTSTGPEERLNTMMLAVGWSLAAAYIILFSLVGASVMVGIRRLMSRPS